MRTSTMTAALLAVLVVAGAAQAGTPKKGGAEPWTVPALHQALKDRPAGDAARGARLNQELFCASCHGADGSSPSHNWPHLRGQRGEYVFKMLLDYQTGLRHEDERADIMVVVARAMDLQAMADVAAFYASQPLPPADTQAARSAAAEALVRRGDPTRLITPCAACHGVNGEGGHNETPALAAMPQAYFVRTMQAYKDGHRHNDVNQGMSQFARKLSDEEIRELADYYAGLAPRR